jgi:hypothetical protein
MGWYPSHVFRVNGDPVPNNEDNSTVVNAAYMNDRDGEITAIEQALGAGLVPSGTVSLSTYFKTDGTNVLMVYNTGGNVGIGTAFPQTQLHQRKTGGSITFHEFEVNGLAAEYPNAFADLDFSADRDGSGRSPFARIRLQRDNASFNNNDASIQFWTGNSAASQGQQATLTERMRITSSGFIGIGTANPQARLHVDGQYGGEVKGGPNNVASSFIFNDSRELGTTDTGALNIRTGNGSIYVDRILIKNNVDANNGVISLLPNGGKVGIGTTAPDTRLDIHDGAIEFSAMSDPGAPAPNGARLFARVYNGKTQLVVRFDSGAEQVLATEP